MNVRQEWRWEDRRRQERRQEAAARVAALHRPLREIFADLRADLAVLPDDEPPEPAAAPVAAAPVPDAVVLDAVVPDAVVPDAAPQDAPPAGPAASADGRVDVAPEPVVPADAPVEVAPEVAPAADPPVEVAAAVVEPEPPVEAAPEVAPAYQPPVVVLPDDPANAAERRLVVRAAFAAALRDIVTDAANGRPPYDADEVGLQLAMAAEEPLGVAARAGAEAARAAGVPGEGDVTSAGMDAAPDAIMRFATTVYGAIAPRRSFDEPGPPATVDELAGALLDSAAERAERAAYVAGVAAATRGRAGWQVSQRFGEPYCPSEGCFGHNGRLLPPGAALPPYADDCNCTVEVVPA